MPEQLTKYEESVITLIANVKNLGDSQKELRLEVKQGFDELKNNWNSRLSKVEEGMNNADKVFAAKEVEDSRDARADARITKLENWQQRIIGGLTLINILLGIAVAYLFRR